MTPEELKKIVDDYNSVDTLAQSGLTVAGTRLVMVMKIILEQNERELQPFESCYVKSCNIQSVIILLAYKVQGRFCATCKGRNVNSQKLQTKCACSTFPVMNGTYLMRSHNHNQEFAQEFAFSSKNSKSHFSHLIWPRNYNMKSVCL